MTSTRNDMLALARAAYEAFSDGGVEDPFGESIRLLDLLTAGAIRRGGLTQELTAEDVASWAASRAAGVPLEYAVGYAPFMGRLFRCRPGALIPREETELLARVAISLARSRSGGGTARILDVGTGSGNLALTLAHELPDARVMASDISAEAVDLARENVVEHGLDNRVSLHVGSLFEPFDSGLEGSIDLVISNPPYIPSSSIQKMAPEIRDHEPAAAFDGGSFGIDIFRGLIRGGAAFLRHGGALAFEIGAGQDRLVRRILEGSGAFTQIEAHTDTGGTIRVFSARKA